MLFILNLVNDSDADPHSIPVGGSNAPIWCLPTAKKTREEEELARCLPSSPAGGSSAHSSLSSVCAGEQNANH